MVRPQMMIEVITKITHISLYTKIQTKTNILIGLLPLCKSFSLIWSMVHSMNWRKFCKCCKNFHTFVFVSIKSFFDKSLKKYKIYKFNYWNHRCTNQQSHYSTNRCQQLVNSKNSSSDERNEVIVRENCVQIPVMLRFWGNSFHVIFDTVTSLITLTLFIFSARQFTAEMSDAWGIFDTAKICSDWF